MSKFYVGQPVRMVRSRSGRPDREGVVIEVGPWDKPGGYAVLSGGEEWLCEEWNLEPLTPPKQQETITWDECVCDRHGRYRQPITAGASHG